MPFTSLLQAPRSPSQTFPCEAGSHMELFPLKCSLSQKRHHCPQLQRFGCSTFLHLPLPLSHRIKVIRPSEYTSSPYISLSSLGVLGATMTSSLDSCNGLQWISMSLVSPLSFYSLPSCQNDHPKVKVWPLPSYFAITTPASRIEL